MGEERKAFVGKRIGAPAVAVVLASCPVPNGVQKKFCPPFAPGLEHQKDIIGEEPGVLRKDGKVIVVEAPLAPALCPSQSIAEGERSA